MEEEIDSLTRLPGYSLLLARLEEEVARSRRYGLPASLLLVVVQDLDTLAMTRGREGADMALCRLSLLCLSGVREYDFVARVSADTFALLLMDTDAAGAEEGAAHLRRSVAALDMSEDDVPLFLKVTVTAFTFGSDLADTGNLLEAQQALTAAREIVTARLSIECGV